MPSPYKPQGEILPPAPHEVAHHRPMPDYESEATRPNSRTRGWNVLAAPGTYLLVGINCAVYLWMVLNGVSPTDPTSQQLIHYGANVPSLVLGHGEWYRLLTATFVHVGILHIATNMWCLWNLGLLGEPLLGPMGLIAVYVLTGIAGSLLSTGHSVWLVLWYHIPADFVGAGASGAVFGIAGILIVLLSNRKLPIPWSELQRLRRSVIWFAVLNLLLGVGANYTSIVHVDNYAHLGGFLSGLAMGVPLLPKMMSGRTRYLERQKVTFATAAFGLALFGYWIANLR